MMMYSAQAQPSTMLSEIEAQSISTKISASSLQLSQ